MTVMNTGVADIHRLPLDEHDRACGVFGQPLDRSDQ